MSKTDGDQPATKADLNSLKSVFKADINSLESKLTGNINSLGSNLRSEMQDIKSELKIDSVNNFKILSGEILKLNFKIDRMEGRLNTEFATKGDINRVFNLLDGISGDIKSYQRKDTLRGEAVMQHGDQLAAHETRITLLEEKK